MTAHSLHSTTRGDIIRGRDRWTQTHGSTPWEESLSRADHAAETLLFLLATTFAPETPAPGPVGGPCPKIDNVIAFLRRRFAGEERIMREVGYPEMAIHAFEHRALIARLARLRQQLRVGRYDSAHFLDVLETWAVVHIERHDKPLGRFVMWHEVVDDVPSGGAPSVRRHPATH